MELTDEYSSVQSAANNSTTSAVIWSVVYRNTSALFPDNVTYGNATTSNHKQGYLLDDLYELQVLRYVVLALYLATFVLGILGNTLTIVVILRYKKMKTVASCFILNLAVADDLFMFSLPFLAHNTYRSSWLFGSAMCKLMNAFYGINLYASIFTMVVMSVDRLSAVAWPLQSIRYRTVYKAMLACLVIWLCCITIMMPLWLYAHAQYKSDGSLRCTIFWPSNSALQHRWFWTNFELFVGFFIPILIMVTCYSLLLRKIVRGRPVTREQSKAPVKRVTVMVFTVTLVFIVCWTPYHIIQYINAVKARQYSEGKTMPESRDMVEHAIFNTVAQGLVFLSSCCNPLIYGLSSSNFRRFYMDVLCFCCSLPHRQRRGTSSTGQTRMTSVRMLGYRHGQGSVLCRADETGNNFSMIPRISVDSPSKAVIATEF